MQRNGAIKRNDVCARSKHWSKWETAAFQWFRTYERPMVYAAHCREIYRATVDNVSCLALVRAQLPSQMRWSMLPKMHNLKDKWEQIENEREIKKSMEIKIERTDTKNASDNNVDSWVCACALCSLWYAFDLLCYSKLAPIHSFASEQTSWKIRIPYGQMSNNTLVLLFNFVQMLNVSNIWNIYTL